MRTKVAFSITLISTMLVFILAVTGLATQIAFADVTERNVASYSELVEAIAQSEDGDVISIDTDIVVDDEVVIDKSITINGNGYSVKVPSPGLTDAGILNPNPSTFRVFDLSTGGTSITINNLTIMGGDVEGGGLRVTPFVSASLNHVYITNSGGPSNGGGGISNQGSLFIKNSVINRNGADHGGGFLNTGFMVIESSSFTENRSLSYSGGGGAGENKGGGQLYINNCTFSNNKSTELGGAINDYQGMSYIMNSTFTGNVAYGGGEDGGALRGSASVVVNCLVAYNYCIDNPTYALNDYYRINAGDDLSSFRMISSVFNAESIDGYNNYLYTGKGDGSDNTLVSGGINTRVLAADGSETGSGTVFQPFLFTPPTANTAIVPLKEPVPDFLNKGVRTIFDPYAATPVFAYFHEDTDDENNNSWYVCSSGGSSVAWSTLSSPDLSKEVTTDQIGNDRGSVIGGTGYATESLYMVKLIFDPATAHGAVHGATVYGDVYKAGESVTIIANPDQGYYFSKWMRQDSNGSDTELSTSNPLQFTVSEDVIFYPLYTQSPNLKETELEVTVTPPLDAGGSFKAEANLTGENDLSGKPVTFYVMDESGKIIYSETVLTDDEGKVSFSDWTPSGTDSRYEAYVSFPGDSANGASISEAVPLVKPEIEITWGSAADITYGTSLAYLTITGESANLAGSFGFADATQSTGNVGQQTVTRYFTPENSSIAPFSEELNYSVLPKQLTSAMVSVSNCSYNGSKQDGSLKVSDGSPSLITANDYTAAYSNNIEVGTATVTITATDTGNYTGSVTVEFSVFDSASPINPGTPDNGSGSQNDLSNTGDQRTMYLFVFLLAACLGGAFVTSAARRRSKK